MTIHRSQGLTLQKAWIDTRKTGRTSGFSDVAISGKKNIFFHHAAGSAHRQYEANPFFSWLPDWARWAQKKIHLSGTSNFVIWAIDAMGSTRAAVEMQNEIFQRKRESGWWRVPT